MHQRIKTFRCTDLLIHGILNLRNEFLIHNFMFDPFLVLGLFIFHFDFKLTYSPLLKNVSFLGNPLKCDCHVRPLVHFYRAVQSLPRSFTDIICSSPIPLAGKFLYEVMDENLSCMNFHKHDNDDLNIMPDLIFRDIQ